MPAFRVEKDNREKIDAIRELEQAGYVVRLGERDERGRLQGADYVIYEQPQTPPALDLPTLECKASVFLDKTGKMYYSYKCQSMIKYLAMVYYQEYRQGSGKW